MAFLNIYDPDSVEFINSYQAYKYSIEKHGSINDMLKYIAHCILKNGTDNLIEGVGYVREQGKTSNTPFSGIYVRGTVDNFFFEINS